MFLLCGFGPIRSFLTDSFLERDHEDVVARLHGLTLAHFSLLQLAVGASPRGLHIGWWRGSSCYGTEITGKNDL